MTITIQPETGETELIFKKLIEPHLPPSFADPDSVVLAVDGFRLRWQKGPVKVDATVILKAGPDG